MFVFVYVFFSAACFFFSWGNLTKKNPKKWPERKLLVVGGLLYNKSVVKLSFGNQFSQLQRISIATISVIFVDLLKCRRFGE